MADQAQQGEQQGVNIGELLSLLGDKEVRIYALQRRIAELEQKIKALAGQAQKAGPEK